MSPATAPTPLHHLTRHLRGAASVPASQATPAAILWPDRKREWLRLLPSAQTHIPELLVLGGYNPDRRTGPAIWLRCVVDRTIVPEGFPSDRPLILYLPGVERGQLRAGQDCLDALKPLVELMFRGVAWHHPNGRDWSARAFLRSERGLGLSVACDAATTAALHEMLDEVAVTPMTELRRRRLDAAVLHKMAGIDAIRDVLRWMGDPEGERARRGSRWNAFRRACRQELGFDPETEADVTAGARLGRGDGPWAEVWTRFTEAPSAYPGVPELLRRSRPAGELALHRERWPDLNDEAEASARRTLERLPESSAAEAVTALRELAGTHAPRRKWVWAALGHSPMAQVIEPLARLAEAAASAIGGATPDDVARVYAGRGWQADAAARDALAQVPAQDEDIVAKVVRHLMRPWLEESAQAFQAALERRALPSAGEQPVVEAREDECIVFVDGLRYELGHDLAAKLERRDCRVKLDRRWAALPTVTATGKPAVTPVAGEVAGAGLTPDFRARMGQAGRPVTAAELRAAMEARGYQMVGDGTLDMPLGEGARGWLECGRIDKLGHEEHGPRRFARLVAEELEEVAGRIAGLLELGWRSVQVVTDHGWLFLPGGLPMVTLPRHLTESQWARAAAISGEATPDVPRHPWHWNPNRSFATPSGIACFSKRPDYAHGGVSLQECLVPDIRVRRSAAEAGVTATIRSVHWRRLRCYAEITARGGAVTADLRLGSASGRSVAAKAKRVDADGSVSLVLADDEYEDATLVLVVTDGEGRILARRSTRREA